MLPYESLAIASPLSPEEVRQKLIAVVKQGKLFSFLTRSDKPYRGKVERNEFKIARTIWYSNSFLPIIRGRICSEEYGSFIHLTMYPQIAVLGFVILWMGLVGYMFFGRLVDIILSALWSSIAEQTLLYALVIPGGFLAFSYLLTMGSFKFESIKSREFLRDLFEESAKLECEIRHYGMTTAQVGIVVVLAVISIDILFVVGRLILPSIIQVLK